MEPCSSYAHPQVPVTTVTTQAVYCHSCSAWRLYGNAFTQHDDETFTHLDDLHADLGPFDGAPEALALVRAWLTAQLLGDGRPWDQGFSWNQP